MVALERSSEFLALEALMLSIMKLFEQYMEYCIFDQSITILYNYFESDVVQRPIYIFRSGGCFGQQSRTSWAILSEGLIRNICVKLIF